MAALRTLVGAAVLLAVLLGHQQCCVAQCETSGSGSCSTDADCRAMISDACPESDIKQAACNNGGCLITISSQGAPGQAGSTQSSFISSSSRGSPGEPGSSKFSSYTSSSPGSPGKPGSSYSGTLTREQVKDISDNIGNKFDNNVNDFVMDVLDL